MTWNTSEAPKDRPIVAIGAIIHQDAGGGAVQPFCASIQWDDLSLTWLEIFSGMALTSDYLARIVIHQWTDCPQPVNALVAEVSECGARNAECGVQGEIIDELMGAVHRPPELFRTVLADLARRYPLVPSVVSGKDLPISRSAPVQQSTLQSMPEAWLHALAGESTTSSLPPQVSPGVSESHPSAQTPHS